MSEDLDELRRAVDAATAAAIEATGALRTAQQAEQAAVAARQLAEGARNQTTAQLAAARAALDQALGLEPPASPAPRRGAPALPAWDDDDEPIREP